MVEDDREIREGVAALLRDEGFEVCEAPSLGLARRFLATGRVGVVVLDLTLVDGDAEALIEEVGAIKNGPALVIFSANMARGDQLARLYGVPFLQKPIDFEMAHATISVALERRLRPTKRRASGLRRRTPISESD
jgi:DNA-binding response OmpR family regulator